ncbi:Fic family protein [Candidatus Woesearchaeota archaeon]|nr:Fic family protein [Candidatus Woesearchaeota archaeon]
MNINKKDIIKFNQENDQSGEFSNESSLEYALSIIRHKISWLKELSYLLRSILVDHVFEDGNKRTALSLAIYYFEEKQVNIDKEKLTGIIWQISKNNVTNINKIMRLLKDAYN